MNQSGLYRMNRFPGRFATAGRYPGIHWNDIIRIRAFGTEVVSAFAIVVSFYYEDGTRSEIHPERKGYYEIVESLNQRFASISADWFDEMEKAGKDGLDVERLLYSEVSST